MQATRPSASLSRSVGAACTMPRAGHGVRMPCPLRGAVPSPGRAAPPVRRSSHVSAAFDPLHITDAALAAGSHGLSVDALLDFVHHAPLAYERVTLPCSSMNCGDAMYRSTLDPVLRKEQDTLITPQGALLVGLAMAYLTATPGVLQGFIDTYIMAPIERRTGTALRKKDVEVKTKLATGGFGTVYRGNLSVDDDRDVIVKKANEFGEAEAWMNERIRRAAPDAAAGFIDAYDDETDQAGPLWLVYEYEGEYTLDDLLRAKAFPYNLEELLLGRELRLPEGPRRQLVIVKLVMRQLLEALAACHEVGIVHRDIKPQNAIISQTDRTLKLIDFGAAADLRIGLNYVPNEYLLDPRYAPPQQYIMSKQTPRAPPAPVAALLSPVLWRLNAPDRFDMYSVGIIMLQMAFPTLRSDNNLIAFNRAFETFDYDLRKWRAAKEPTAGKQLREGFDLLDAQGGAGWDLLCQLLSYDPSERPSARAALLHPWVVGDAGGVTGLVGTVANKASGVVGTAGKRVADSGMGELIAGTSRSEGLTEANLSEELGLSEPTYDAPRNASNTIAWWQQRQKAVRALARRTIGGKAVSKRR